MSEISPRSGFQTHHISTEWGIGSIQGQDFIFAESRLQTSGHYRFQNFLPKSSVGLGTAQAYYLHTYGAASTHNSAGLQIAECCPYYGYRVHSVVRKEIPVLKKNQAAGIFFGNIGGRRKTPLTILSHSCSQKLPIGIFHNRRGGDGAERVPGKADAPKQQSCHKWGQ